MQSYALVRPAAALIALLLVFGCQVRPQRSTPPASTIPDDQSRSPAATDADLTARLKAITDRAGGTVSMTVIHVESGRTASVNGSSALPLYSVFKLPLAIAVLKDVEEKRLQIDQKVHVTPADIVGGTRTNTDMWLQAVDRTIADLLSVSISLSDNTSSDKLLELVGGPEAVTRRMRSLGFNQINIQTTIRRFVETRQNPNVGAADDLAKLLARLQQGQILQPAQRDPLLGFMQKATTGMRRLRGDLPRGTLVGDKTGSGELNEATKVPNATNDVGLITLPNNGGHLAMAVLINDSTLSYVEQEKVIAELARVAYEAFVTK